jgi:hypothetical protein
LKIVLSSGTLVGLAQSIYYRRQISRECNQLAPLLADKQAPETPHRFFVQIAYPGITKISVVNPGAFELAMPIGTPENGLTPLDTQLSICWIAATLHRETLVLLVEIKGSSNQDYTSSRVFFES